MSERSESNGCVSWTKSELFSKTIRARTNLRASSAPFGRGSKNQKFSLPFFFSSAGGVGGADKKMERKFLVLLRRFRLLKEQHYFNIFVCSFLRPHGECNTQAKMTSLPKLKWHPLVVPFGIFVTQICGGRNQIRHEGWGVPAYCCDPSSPWQKPLVEGTIGSIAEMVLAERYRSLKSE